MKKYLKIFLAVILVAATVFSLAACKQNEKSNTDTESKASATDPSPSPANDTSKTEAAETPEITAESRVFVIDSKQDKPSLRKSPSDDSETLPEIPEGAEVTVEEESDGWAKIRVNDKTGWIKSDNVIEITKAEKDESKTQSSAEKITKQAEKKGDSETAKTQAAATTVKESSAKTTANETAASKETSSKTTSAKETSSKPTATKETAKSSTSAYTGTQKPATVHIRIHGRKSDNKEITAKVNPGDSYTNSMAYKAVKEKYPDESVRIKGDNIVNYDPSTGVKDFYMDAYFNDTMEITAKEEDD